MSKHSDNSIIPICLYSNNEYSYIGLPEKIIYNGKIKYNCPQVENIKLIDIYYGLNPDSKPFPPSSDLICIQNIEKKTKKISTIYDSYNKDLNCSIYILIWLEPTPYTVPLYIFTNNEYLIIKTDISVPKGFTNYEIPVIHVVKNINTFSSQYGRCIPDIKITDTVNDCVVKFILNSEYKGKYPNIISYLESNYKNKKKSKNKIIFIIIIIFIILLFIFAIFLYIKMKNKK